MTLREWLAHPATQGIDIDDPRTTSLRRRIIQEKRFLYQIYCDWYRRLVEALPDTPGRVLEIGSGGGFLDELVPDLITSEIFRCEHIRVVLDGHRLPLAAGSLRGIVMNNVLHHLPQPRIFLKEAARCIYPGGALIMNEPWVSSWSRLIYTRLHHEPFEVNARDWEFPPLGPLSGANGALPWIIFERDRAQFEQEFPEWKLHRIDPHTPFSYLVSGGVSMRSLMPGWSFEAWRSLEAAMNPWMKGIAMFATVVLIRRSQELA